MTETCSAPSPGDELTPTRESLLERLRDLGDQGSWQQFFDTYWKLIYCAALKAGLSDAEAEDVVQETIIAVARNMGTFRYDPQVCSFKGWLMLLTRHRIIDHRRKRQVRPESCLPLSEGGTTTGTGPEIPDPAAEQAFEGMWNEEWQKNLVDAAMERVKTAVNPQHYQIFYLHSVKNLTAGRIAELLRVSRAKVYVVRHRVARLVKRQVQVLTERADAEALKRWKGAVS